MIKIGIIGCGLIGNKRATSIRNMSNSNFNLLGCADINIDKAKNLSKNKIKVFDNYIDLIRDSSIDAVIIATLHDSLASITRTLMPPCAAYLATVLPAGPPPITITS